MELTNMEKVGGTILVLLGMATAGLGSYMSAELVTMIATDAFTAQEAEDNAGWNAAQARWQNDSCHICLTLLSKMDRAPYAPMYKWENLDVKQVHNAYLGFQLTRVGRTVKQLDVLPEILPPRKGEKVAMHFLDMGK